MGAGDGDDVVDSGCVDGRRKEDAMRAEESDDDAGKLVRIVRGGRAEAVFFQLKQTIESGSSMVGGEETAEDDSERGREVFAACLMSCRSRGFDELALELIDQGEGESVLVGEVLVEGADGDAGPLGDGVGVVAGEPIAFENASSGFEDDGDGLGGALLHRLFSAVARLWLAGASSLRKREFYCEHLLGL